MKLTDKFVKHLKKRWFYYLMLFIPLMQVAVFYVYVNINSVILSVRKYDIFTNSFSFAGFSNFEKVFEDIKTQPIVYTAVKNALLLFALLWLLGFPIAVMVAYFLSKGPRGSNFYQVMLYLPSIVSTVTFVIMYKYFCERAYPAIMETFFHKEVEGLLSNYDTTLGTILFFNVWTGFGPQVIMFTGAIKSIDPALFDAGKIDGVNWRSELWHIVLPGIYSTLVVFIISGLAIIFTNQMNLFSFYSRSAPPRLWTMGYYFYAEVSKAETMADFPYLSALGVLMTIVIVPLTIGLKKLLEKVGPKET